MKRLPKRMHEHWFRCGRIGETFFSGIRYISHFLFIIFDSVRLKYDATLVHFVKDGRRAENLLKLITFSKFYRFQFCAFSSTELKAATWIVYSKPRACTTTYPPLLLFGRSKAKERTTHSVPCSFVISPKCTPTKLANAFENSFFLFFFFVFFGFLFLYSLCCPEKFCFAHNLFSFFIQPSYIFCQTNHRTSPCFLKSLTIYRCVFLILFPSFDLSEKFSFQLNIEYPYVRSFGLLVEASITQSKKRIFTNRFFLCFALMFVIEKYALNVGRDLYDIWYVSNSNEYTAPIPISLSAAPSVSQFTDTF